MQDDDKTVIISSSGTSNIWQNKSLNTNGVKVTLIGVYADLVNEAFFASDFSLGRAQDNDFVVPDGTVSRYHLRVSIEYGEWYIHDVGSTNGAFIHDKQIKNGEKLQLPCVIRLGKTESYIQIQSLSDNSVSIQTNDSDITQIVPQSNKAELLKTSSNVDDVKQRFLGKSSDNMGEYTKMVRHVIHEDKIKKTRKYKWGIGIVFIFLCTILGYAGYLQTKISNAKNIAIEMFYNNKSMEIEVSLLEIKLREENRTSLQEEVKLRREKLQEMQQQYKSYIDELNSAQFVVRKIKKVTRNLGIQSTTSTEYERELILRVAQKFGECELELSEGFVDEVKNYINKWKSSSRMKRAMKRLEENNYAPVIINAMKKENLPPEFLYLAMQESDFDTHAIGPETRYGIAKGAWQFLPGTGKDFGVEPGELADDRVYDATDERFNFDKAAYAAAKYLKHIYSTEAQASALLVMAGYNYGHNRVKKKIRGMPDNPKDKNFWKFINQFEIPKETYDYVFYIFSAAVIGENPQYFGFDFQSPFTE